MLIPSSHAARLIGVSQSTIRLWANSGKLPAQKLAGGMNVFELADVERLAAERQVRK